MLVIDKFIGTAVRGLAAASLLFMASAASAAPFAAPPGLGPDIDGSGYFAPTGVGSLSLELFDLGDSVTSFGFFDVDTPATLVPIFEAGDTIGDLAIIDFAAGYVFDVEDGAVQSFFAPVDIMGFYLDLPGIGTLFSVPEYNAGGLDLMAAHKDLVSPEFSHLLFYTGPADSTAPIDLIYWVAMTDIERVPVPATLGLLLLGLVMMRRTQRS